MMPIRSVLVISPESPYPLQGGGQYRTASLIHYFARFAEVDLILISESGKPALLPPGLVRSQTVIPLPKHSKGLLERYSRNARRALAGVALLLALSGMAAALWQHFKAAASASCNLTLADKIVSGTLHLDALLPGVFEARASCADGAVNLLGVPYDFWALALFVMIALAVVQAIRVAGGR